MRRVSSIRLLTDRLARQGQRMLQSVQRTHFFALYLILLTLLFLFSLQAESLWQHSNLYSDQDSIAAGSILKIRFHEKNLLRYKNKMKVGNTREANAKKPKIPVFSFLPSFDLSQTAEDNNNVDYETEREFSTRIAVRVASVLSNDVLRLQGTHTVIVNGQREQISIAGFVSRKDVRTDNTVYSTDIANLSFALKGPAREEEQRINNQDLQYQTNQAAMTNQTNAGAQGAGEALPELSEERKRALMLQYLNRVSQLLFQR